MKLYKCKKVPFKGYKMYLSDGKTAVFTVNGVTGQYVLGVWIEKK